MLSDVVHGEVIGVRKDRDQTSATTLLNEALTARQRAAVTAVCTDMHRPYLNAVSAAVTHAEIVFDKFPVLQHARAALDEVRRQEFFRAGAVMRAHGRGKRWLLLRRWKTVLGSKRAELQALFAANRRLFKAYVLREQLDRLWTYKTRPGVLDFLLGWIKALRWPTFARRSRLSACSLAATTRSPSLASPKPCSWIHPPYRDVQRAPRTSATSHVRGWAACST